ncbi:MAG: PBP1A family penicillin-binding protein [Acidobacteriota bacterium]|nr:PBP1A family penicillin-binding protein [Acidobacteriota bacterium]
MYALFSLRNALRVLLMLVLVGAGAAVYVVWQIHQDVDAVSERFTLDSGPQSTVIFDSKDRAISALYREHRIPVALEQISGHLVNAVLVTEDRRFYQHTGVDFRRIAGSTVANLRQGRIVEGGSTITQQFVRGAFLDRTKTFSRKIREAWLAAELETRFGKNEILQAYLNRVYLGDGYYGVEAASRGYFGKPASQLNATEGATLAALINRPSGYGLRRTPARVRERRDWVLQEMLQEGLLDPGVYASSVVIPVAATLSSAATRSAQDPAKANGGPYFVDTVTQMLYEQFGIEKVLTGGLRVYTTLDSDVQRFAEQAVLKRLAELDKRRVQGEPLQAALVAIEPSTGFVRAMVGGRNFVESPFNRATDAKRQPGSAFKPFVFAAALEAGYSPGTTIGGLEESVASFQGAYLPGGEHEMESTTLRSALVHSSNRAAVHLLQRVGLRPTIDLAARMGLDSMPAVPSLALGTGEVSLLNLTSAYTVFANGGILQPPTFIRRVEDADGRVLYRAESEGHRVLSETTAFLMASMLADVVDHGTAYGARTAGFSLPAGGKTGSTDDHNDAWFVGFTPNLAAGVWMGYDRPQQIMRRGFASVVAVPAWAGFMKQATTDNKPDWITAPAGITHIRRCKESGGLATEYCELYGEVYGDMVGIGRSPDACPLHTSTGLVVAPIALSSIPPQP